MLYMATIPCAKSWGPFIELKKRDFNSQQTQANLSVCPETPDLLNNKKNKTINTFTIWYWTERKDKTQQGHFYLHLSLSITRFSWCMFVQYVMKGVCSLCSVVYILLCISITRATSGPLGTSHHYFKSWERAFDHASRGVQPQRWAHKQHLMLRCLIRLWMKWENQWFDGLLLVDKWKSRITKAVRNVLLARSSFQ